MKKLAIALLFALMTIIGACGDDDDGGSTSDTNPTIGGSSGSSGGTGDASTEDARAAADSSVADTSAPDTSTADTSTPTTTTVMVTSNVFTPSTVTVRVGDTVRWVWGGGIHNVTSGTGCTPNGTFTSGVPTSDTAFTFSRTFDTAGTFPYFCEVHCSVGMTGTVVVQ